MTRIHHYDSPFADENFKRSRHAKHPNAQPCGVCGRATLAKKAMIHCVNGWMNDIVHPEDPYDKVSADMGWWYVGPDCVKKIPAEFLRAV